jgi:2-polyprenyl-3-methyl-5-hydroxy-6-metoxy-1,4-benzoquinol methylase
MDLKTTYNRIAEDWTKDHENDTWWIRGTDKFSSYLKARDRVLDVGCASGIKSKYLSQKGFIVDGVDLSDKMIELAKKRLPTNRFFVHDINEPLNLESKYNGIFAQAVLLHIQKNNAENVIGNLIDLLEPQGYFYLAVKKMNEGQAEEQIVKENDYGYEYERFFSFFTLGELEKYLQNFGLKIAWSDISSTGKSDWVQLIAQK